MCDRREVAVCTLVFLFSPHPLPRKTYTILYLLGEGKTAECLIQISSSISFFPMTSHTVMKLMKTSWDWEV